MKILLAFGIAAGILTAGCMEAGHRSAGVYVLLDAAENHPQESNVAREVIPLLLQILMPADTLAAASIATANFSEKDIIARVTFDQRPSMANSQKRAFLARFDRFVQTAANSRNADISGGMIQAIDFLNRSDPESKTILILADLRKIPTGGTTRDMPFQLAGFNVVVLQTSKSQPDSRAVKTVQRRWEQFRKQVESGNGSYQVIEQPQQLEDILQQFPEKDGG